MSDTETTQNTETQDKPQVSPPETQQGSNEETQSEALIPQTEVDRIMTRVRHDARQRLLEDLGVENLDSLKSILDAKKQADEAAMSELEKYQAQLDKANKRAEEAERQRVALETKILTDSRKQTFTSAIRDNGGSNPERVYALLQVEKPDDFNSIFGDGATPDDNKLKALIKQVQADYPEYFGTSGAGSPSNSNGIAPNSQNTEDLEMRLKKKFGKL